MRNVCPGRLGHSSVTTACGGCDERLSVEMVIFYYYTVMFEAKLVMEVPGLGYAVREGEMIDKGGFPKLILRELH